MSSGSPSRSLAVRGPFRGVSGHDHHTREFVRQLVRQGVRVQLTDLAEWHTVKLPRDDWDPWFEQLAGPVDAACTLHFCMPHQVRLSPGRLAVNYTMFEADRVPPDWVARGRSHDLVIVPTPSSRDAWRASGCPPGQLRVCPLGVDVDRFRPANEPLPLAVTRGRPVADYRTRVLNVSEARPRKNLVGLVRAWITATSVDDDAILIIKLGPPHRPATIALLRELAVMQQRLGRSLAHAAPVLFVDRLLADAEMPRLFAAATHYWSMSHGEGWDQPMVEAGAAGLRLIAPRHSAYLAYLDSDVAQPAGQRHADRGRSPGPVRTGRRRGSQRGRRATPADAADGLPEPDAARMLRALAAGPCVTS